MKKILTVLCLLVISAGVANANQTQATAPQEVEIQSQVDKQTFSNNNDKFTQNPRFNSEFQKGNSNIKFDKSVKDKKFYTKDKQKFDKNKKFNRQTTIYNYDKRPIGYHRGQRNMYRHHKPHYQMRVHRFNNKMINKRAYNKPIKKK